MPSRRRACCPGSSAPSSSSSRTAVLVYGDTNSTLAGTLAAAKARHAGRPRRGGAPLVRPLDAGGAEPRSSSTASPRSSSAPARLPSRISPRRRSRRAFTSSGTSCSTQTSGSRRSRASARSALEGVGVRPAEYLLLTLHRRGERPLGSLARIVGALNALSEPIVFPAHPRTRRGARRERDRARATRSARAAGRLHRLRRARLPGAPRPHRLGRRSEGGLLVLRAVRDAADDRPSGWRRSRRVGTGSSATIPT